MSGGASGDIGAEGLSAGAVMSGLALALGVVLAEGGTGMGCATGEVDVVDDAPFCVCWPVSEEELRFSSSSNSFIGPVRATFENAKRSP